MSIYQDTDYLAKKWNYSELERLYQELNNLLQPKVCDKTYAKGLVFKPIGNYITLAGAPSGSASWYMRVSYENYQVCLADRQPEMVIQKAIYWFTECFKGGRKPTETFMAGNGWLVNEIEASK